MGMNLRGPATFSRPVQDQLIILGDDGFNIGGSVNQKSVGPWHQQSVETELFVGSFPWETNYRSINKISQGRHLQWNLTHLNFRHQSSCVECLRWLD
jgi:hypothetical protein